MDAQDSWAVGVLHPGRGRAWGLGYLLAPHAAPGNGRARAGLRQSIPATAALAQAGWGAEGLWAWRGARDGGWERRACREGGAPLLEACLCLSHA